MLADYTHPDRVYVIERSKTNPIELS
jgi:hypothetical protein